MMSEAIRAVGERKRTAGPFRPTGSVMQRRRRNVPIMSGRARLACSGAPAFRTCLGPAGSRAAGEGAAIPRTARRSGGQGLARKQRSRTGSRKGSSVGRGCNLRLGGIGACPTGWAGRRIHAPAEGVCGCGERSEPRRELGQARTGHRHSCRAGGRRTGRRVAGPARALEAAEGGRRREFRPGCPVSLGCVAGLCPGQRGPVPVVRLAASASPDRDHSLAGHRRRAHRLVGSRTGVLLRRCRSQRGRPGPRRSRVQPDASGPGASG